MKFFKSFCALIYLCIINQSEAVGSTNKQCYKAKTCIHNNHEKCGVSSSGTPRRFLDSCDIFEFNCLKDTDFKKTPMIQCKHLKSLYERQKLHGGYESEPSDEVLGNNLDSMNPEGPSGSDEVFSNNWGHPDYVAGSGGINEGGGGSGGGGGGGGDYYGGGGGGDYDGGGGGGGGDDYYGGGGGVGDNKGVGGGADYGGGGGDYYPSGGANAGGGETGVGAENGGAGNIDVSEENDDVGNYDGAGVNGGAGENGGGGDGGMGGAGGDIGNIGVGEGDDLGGGNGGGDPGGPGSRRQVMMGMKQ